MSRQLAASASCWHQVIKVLIRMHTFRLNPTKRVVLPSIEVDSAMIAPGLGLEPEEFKRLLEAGKIFVTGQGGRALL